MTRVNLRFHTSFVPWFAPPRACFCTATDCKSAAKAERLRPPCELLRWSHRTFPLPLTFFLACALIMNSHRSHGIASCDLLVSTSDFPSVFPHILSRLCVNNNSHRSHGIASCDLLVSTSDFPSVFPHILSRLCVNNSRRYYEEFRLL